jgi:predicted Zn-dependent protease
MTIAEKKLELISWLSNLHDEEILDQLESVRKKAALEKYQKSLSPMSAEELENSLAEAEEDIQAGRVISQEELKKRIKAGKIL